VVISDDLRNRMIKPHNLEIGMWKENVQRKPAKRVKPTSAMLIEKYQQQLEEDRRYQVARGIKQGRFFEDQNRSDLQNTLCGGERQRRMAQHSIGQEPGIRKNPRFTNRSGLGNPDHRVNCSGVLCDGEESSRRPEQIEEHVVMVGLWPCKVSSEIHIIERHISEPVREDMGKTTATKPEDENPKRALVVLSKGREVVGPGYSRLTNVAAKVTDRGENSGNLSWVSRVSQYNSTDRQADRVNRVSQDNCTDRQTDRVSRVSQNSSMDQQADQVSRVGNTEQKTRGSSRVANTKSRVMENSANTESWVTETSANTDNQVM
jgi:hypothetical protein